MFDKTEKIYKIRGCIVKNAKKRQKGIAKWFIMMYNKSVLKMVPIVHFDTTGRTHYYR